MKYFGTDGIRGSVEEFLTPDLTLKIGKAAGKVFKKNDIDKICIGIDPRVSSSFLKDILIGALNSQGISVVDLGIVSTPVVSFTIINNKDIEAGIMVSASHNPYYDNGIKFFGSDGKKIIEKMEKEIESKIEVKIKVNLDSIGQKIKDEKYVWDYINYCISQGVNLEGKKIALDCSNGSSFAIAPKIFEELGSEVVVIANKPNGYNINDNVGSTHTETLSKFVKQGDFDFAFSYDGDADRVMLINSLGEVLDGDYIIYILAKYFKKNNSLIKNSIVSTVMTNLGFKNAIKALEVENFETSVGDKYVMRELDKQDITLGGEQSGHIIISDLLPTGDGILCSVILAKLIIENEIDLIEIKKELVKYPQTLINCKCEDKDKVMNNKELFEEIEVLEEKMGTKGRILVRASGTENLIRVMVEHQDEDECEKLATLLVEKVKKI